MASRSHIEQRRRVLDKIRKEKVKVTGTRYTPVRKKAVTREFITLKYGSAAELSKELKRRGYVASKATVLADLRALDVHARARGRGPHLTFAQKRARVVFAKWCLARRRTLRVLWSDETWLNSGNSNTKKKKQWLRGKEKPLPIVGLRNDPKLMVWLCFDGTGARECRVLCAGQGVSVTKEGMKKKVYKPALPFLKRRSRAGFVFLEDNARVHCQEYLRANGVKLPAVRWPALSPDLNVCEEANSHVKSLVADKNVYGIDEIEKAAKEVFAALPASYFAKLEALWWRKLEACVANGGEIVRLPNKRRYA